MTNPPRKTARSRWVNRQLQLTRSRQKAWREQPERMEAIRKQATAEAKRQRQIRDEGLRQVIALWPASMTANELKDLVARDIEYDGRYSSLTYRFTRKAMLWFGADGFWHNLCKLPPTETSLKT